MLDLMAEPAASVEAHPVDWMSFVARHVRGSFGPPPLGDAVLGRVVAPVLLPAGERETFLPGDRLLPLCPQAPAPPRRRGRPGAAQLLPHDRPGPVSARVSAFLAT